MVDSERLSPVKVSDTTLRARRDEWIKAGVFDALIAEALAAYDRIVGLDLSEVAVEGSLHKAPCGGEGTGKNPTDRGKLGWKWSIATDAAGIVIGWELDGANRHDIKLLEPTLAAVEARGLVVDIETLHLDRGYDSAGVRAHLDELGIDEAVIAKRRKRGEPVRRRPLSLGRRWTVERTNSLAVEPRSDAPQPRPPAPSSPRPWVSQASEGGTEVAIPGLLVRPAVRTPTRRRKEEPIGRNERQAHDSQPV